MSGLQLIASLETYQYPAHTSNTKAGKEHKMWTTSYYTSYLYVIYCAHIIGGTYACILVAALVQYSHTQKILTV